MRFFERYKQDPTSLRVSLTAVFAVVILVVASCLAPSQNPIGADLREQSPADRITGKTWDLITSVCLLEDRKQLALTGAVGTKKAKPKKSADISESSSELSSVVSSLEERLVELGFSYIKKTIEPSDSAMNRPESIFLDCGTQDSYAAKDAKF